MAIEAQLAWGEDAQDERGMTRRSLRLAVEGSSQGLGAVKAVVHNLSETGILIESPIDLAVGEVVNFEMPHAGTVPATIKWASGRFFGCEFAQPIAPSGVSAALLKAEFEPAARHSGQTSREQADRELGKSDALPLGAKAWTIIILSLACWALLGLLAFLIL